MGIEKSHLWNNMFENWLFPTTSDEPMLDFSKIHNLKQFMGYTDKHIFDLITIVPYYA
jgi:hypothetical protein